MVERKLAANKNGPRIAIDHANRVADVVREELESYKGLTPAAPVEVTFQTSLYIDLNKRQRGIATFDFPDVVFSIDGTPITVNRYEIYGQLQGPDPLPPFRLMNTSAQSSIYATDLLPGSSWLFRIRALSDGIIRPGLWSPDYAVTVVADSTPPPQPSAPVAVAVSGGVKVTWDGLAAGGGVMPGDFDHVELAFGTTSSPTTVVDTFYGASFSIIPKSAYNTTHFFRLRAVDTSGNASPWSVQSTAIPVPLVDGDIILSAIDAAVTAITNIGASALADGAVLTSKLADNAVTQGKITAGAVSLTKLDTAANNKITQGITDAATADGKAVTAQAAADAAKAQLSTYIAAGTSLITNGSFERLNGQSPEGWPTRSLTYGEASTTTARSGTKILRATPSGNSAYAYTDYIQSAPGRIYLIEYWVRLRETLIAGNENLMMGAFFNTLSSTGATTTYTNYTDVAGVSVKLSALSTTDWTKVSILKALPAGLDIAQIRFGPRIPGLAPTGNNFELDDFVALDITDAKNALDAAAAAQAAANTAITNAATAQASADSRNIITNSVVDAGAGIPGKTSGDRWQKWTTLATGGKLLATWRWNGSAWIAEAMDPTYIPLLDIGAATFGTLDGTRMTARSIEADRLLVSRGANLHPDPTGEDQTGWGTNGTGDAAAVFSATGGKSGKGSILISQTATQQGIYYGYNTPARRIRVVPGGTYRIGGWVYASADIPVGGVRLYLKGFDEAGASAVMMTPVAGTEPWNRAVIPANTWTLVSGLVTVPATTTSLNTTFGTYKEASYSTGTVRWSDFSVQQAMAGELIVDGSVTAAKVDAASVAAGIGSFLTIDVSQLNATAAAIGSGVIDKLWTDVVQSRKITTDMLIVSGENLMPDPYFLDTIQNTYRTTATPGTWGIYNDDVSTAKTIKNTDHDATDRTLVLNSTDALVKVMPGEQYALSLQYRLRGNVVASTPDSTMRFCVYQHAPDGTFLRFSNVAASATVTIGTGPTWKTFSDAWTVPVDVGFLRVAVRTNNQHYSGEFEFKMPVVKRKMSADLIVDGGILTKHLTVTEDMTVALLAAHKIKAVDLDANNIVADTATIGVLRGGILISDAVTTSVLKADAITSKHTITGATIQTVATANRGIKITSSGLIQYDSGGNQLLNIGNGSQNLMVGDIYTSRAGTAGVRLINSSSWGLPAIVYSYNGNQGAQEASSFMRYTSGGDPELVHRAPDRAIVGDTGLGFVRIEGDLVLSLGDDATQKMRVEQPFYLDAWSPVNGYQSMTMNGQLVNINSIAGNIKLNSGSYYTQLPGAYSKTTGTSGNVVISSDGGLFRSTSALKYKADPQVIEPDEALLDVPMKDWVDKFALESRLEIEAMPQPWDEETTARYNSISIARIPGAIAEDVIAAGGEAYASFGSDGEVEGLMYDRYVLARTDILHRKYKALLARIEELEARLSA